MDSATLVQAWTQASQSWIDKRRQEVWQTISNNAAQLFQENKGPPLLPALDDLTTGSWTLDQLVALYTHLRYVLARIEAAAANTRVMAYRPWLMRLMMISDSIVPEEYLTPRLRGLFFLNVRAPKFTFTTRNLAHRLRQCGLPILDSDVLQNMAAHWFDPAKGAWDEIDKSTMPCVQFTELTDWLNTPYRRESDNDVRAMVPTYHDPHHIQLSATPSKNLSAPFSIDDLIATRPAAATHFMLLADTLYGRGRLRYWAAQLYYRDPRAWRALRQLVHTQDVYVGVLLQALLFMQPTYPTHMERVKTTLTLLETNSTQVFFAGVTDPTGIPAQVAVPSPFLDAKKWVNEYWKSTETFQTKGFSWKYSTAAAPPVVSEASEAKQERIDVYLRNNYHFQTVFDCALAAFHYHLCHKDDVVRKYPDALPFLLVRSGSAYQRHRRVVEEHVHVYLTVAKDGALSYHTPANGIWNDQSWFLIGLMDDQVDLNREGVVLEEDWKGPAPPGPDLLRVTKCSFFRRYIPDTDVSLLPGPGMCAPFTLLPMTGFA